MALKDLFSRRTFRLSLFFVLGVFFLLPEDASFSQQPIVRLTDIKIQQLGITSQITLRISEPVDVLDLQLVNPPRLVLDLVGENIYSFTTDRLTPSSGMIKEVRCGLFRQSQQDLYPGRKLDALTVELREKADYAIKKENGFIQIEIVPTKTEKTDLTLPAPAPFLPVRPPKSGQTAEERLAQRERLTWSPPPMRTPLPGSYFLSLRECIEVALANNGTIQVAKEQARLSRLRVVEARRGLFPTASIRWTETHGEGGLNTQDFEGREFTAEAQQLIFDGGRAVNLVRQAEANYEVAQATYDRLAADTRFDVTQAYYNLARLKQVQEVHREVFESMRSELERNRRRFELGLLRELDFLTVESMFRDIEKQGMTVDQDLSLSRLTLTQAMGLSPDQVVDIDADLSYEMTDVHLEGLTSLALANRPEAEVAELLVQFNAFGKKVAESQENFQVNLTGSLGKRSEVFAVQDIELATEWFLGLNVSHPWGWNTISSETISQDKVPAVGQFTSTKFNSHTLRLSLADRLKSPLAEASVRLDEAIEELEKTKRTIVYEVRQAAYDYERAKHQMDHAGLELAMDEDAIRVIQAQTRLDEARAQDLFDAYAKLFQGKQGYLEALGTYHISLAALNRAIGIEGYFRSTKAPQKSDAPLSRQARTLLRAQEELFERHPGEGVPVDQPKPKVLYVSPHHDFVIVNRGKREGVKVGQLFWVFRDGAKVGEIRSIRVTPDKTACDIIHLETIEGLHLLDDIRPPRKFSMKETSDREAKDAAGE